MVPMARRLHGLLLALLLTYTLSREVDSGSCINLYKKVISILGGEASGGEAADGGPARHSSRPWQRRRRRRIDGMHYAWHCKDKAGGSPTAAMTGRWPRRAARPRKMVPPRFARPQGALAARQPTVAAVTPERPYGCAPPARERRLPGAAAESRFRYRLRRVASDTGF